MPARVVHESEVPAEALPPEDGTKAEARVLIDRAAGSRRLLQRVLRLAPGGRARVGHPAAEEVLYVAEGLGWTGAVEGERHLLEPGTGALVPPGTPARIAAGRAGVVLVSVLSPQPEAGGGGPAPRPGDAPYAPVRVTREADQEPEPAGDDRSFRVLIDPRFGSRTVTQFVGSIERSRAPFHTHPYEEAIYVIGGEGVLHADGLDVPVRRGSSVFLPPGTPHCLENAGAETLRLLGVFSPPGSPAGRAEAREPAPG